MCCFTRLPRIHRDRGGWPVDDKCRGRVAAEECERKVAGGCQCVASLHLCILTLAVVDYRLTLS